MAQTKPAGNGRVCGMCMLTIYAVLAISFASCHATQLWGHSCNAYTCSLISPNTIVCVVISSDNALVVTLLVGWLLSMNSFSITFTILEFLGSW